MTTVPKQLILVLCWFAFVQFVNLLWLDIDQRSMRWDDADNLQMSERSHLAIEEGRILDALDTQGASRPNFVPFLAGLSYFLVGHDTDRAVFLLNFVSFLLIFLCLYGIGAELFDRNAGLLACIIYTSYLNIILWSRQFTLDMPLSAICYLTLLLLIRLDRCAYRNRRLLVGLGISVALGVCTKHMYAVFMFAPLAYACYRALQQGRTHSKPLLWSLASGCLVGAAYHAFNWRTFYELLKRALAPKTTSLATTGFQLPSVTDLLRGFYETEIGALLFVVLFCIGLPFSIVAFKRQRIFLFAWLFGGAAIVLFVIRVSVPYYFIPLLPAFALISVSWLSWRPAALRGGQVIGPAKVVAALLVAMFAIGNYLERSLGTANPVSFVTGASAVLAAEKSIDSNPFVAHNYWQDAYVDGNIATLPYPHRWPVDEMLDELAPFLDPRQSERRYRLSSVTNYEWMNLYYLQYRIYAKRLHKALILHTVLPPKELDHEFVITKSGSVLAHSFYVHAWAQEIQAYADRLLVDDARVLREAGYVRIKSFPLPDGSTGSVWYSPERTRDIYLSGGLPFTAANGSPSRSSFDIDSDKRPVLYQHPGQPGQPPHEITWRGIEVPEGSVLRFGVAVSPQVWSAEKGDGVGFEVEVRSGGKTQLVFREFVDPKTNPQHRRWFDAELPLPEGVPFDLVFRTLPGKSNAYDHAGWSSPVIVRPMR